MSVPYTIFSRVRGAQVKVITDPKDWQASALTLQVKRDEYKHAAAAEVTSGKFAQV